MILQYSVKKTPDSCKPTGHLKAGMNLKRFWTWLTTLGIDREVYNLKYLLTIINNKSLNETPNDGSCETPGINVGFDKWWCRMKNIYIYILIIYLILQLVGAGMKTNFSKIVTGFGGAIALLFSIIFIAYFFVFKGFKFMSFTSKDSIIFPGFNINGTNFNDNDGQKQVATTMFTNRNLQDLLLAEAGIKPQSLQDTLSKMCQTIIFAKKKRLKQKELSQKNTPPPTQSNIKPTSPGIGSLPGMPTVPGMPSPTNMQGVSGMPTVPGMPSPTNMQGVSGMPTVPGMPSPTNIPGFKSPLQRGGGSNEEKMISSKKLEEFKEFLSEIIS